MGLFQQHGPQLWFTYKSRLVYPSFWKFFSDKHNDHIQEFSHSNISILNWCYDSFEKLSMSRFSNYHKLGIKPYEIKLRLGFEILKQGLAQAISYVTWCTSFNHSYSISEVMTLSWKAHPYCSCVVLGIIKNSNFTLKLININTLWEGFIRNKKNVKGWLQNKKTDDLKTSVKLVLTPPPPT